METSEAFSTQKDNQPVVLLATLDILPLGLAVVPWGILYGVMAVEAGLNPWQAQFMSLFVFAGAVQLASLTLFTGSVSSLSILSTTAVISSRHLLYSATLREEVASLPFRWRSALAFFLTDEMFAVAIAYRDKFAVFNPVYSLYAGVMFYLIWNLSTFIGISSGQHIPNLTELGLDFAIAATFIAIVTPSIKKASYLFAAVISGAMAVVWEVSNWNHGIIFATLIGMAMGFIFDKEG